MKKMIDLLSTSTDNLLIEQKLNKLFYLAPNIKEESEFVRLVLSKNGESQHRIGLHASAIIAGENDFCYREQVLSLHYRQIQGHNVDIGLKRIFEEGNSIHEKWQRLFIRGELGAKEDMDRSRFDKHYQLSFTPDAAPIRIGKKDYVVEIKSVNTFQFKHMKSHPSGHKQLQLYMHFTGIKDGFVLAEDKNTQETKVFVYEYNHEVVLPFIERLDAIREYNVGLINNKKMVKGICSSHDCKRAAKCPMRDACFNIGMGRIRLDV